MSNNIILKGNSRLLIPVITQILAINQLLEQKDIGTIYGEPAEEYQARVARYKPQVSLRFTEDRDDVLPGYQASTGRISFRLMDQTSNTISESEATALGRKIKEVFGSNKGYVWNRGKEMITYNDWDKGYYLQILTRNESNAKDLITRVLSVQNHTPNWKNAQGVKNEAELERYPYTPPTEQIMGKTVQGIRRRPNVNARFQYAVLHIHGLAKPVVLYDRSGKKPNPLVV
jgi:hypothetical protein